LRLILQIAIVALYSPIAWAWTPSENPNPHAILTQARDDTRAEHYEIALEKFLWIHKESMNYRPGFTGVRLSYALEDWKMLSRRYPPALTAMIEVRDETESSIRGGSGSLVEFAEFAALNRTLNQNTRTIELASWLSDHRPDLAREVLRISARAVESSQDAEAITKHIVVESEAEELLATYHDLARIAEKYPADSMRRAKALEFANYYLATEAQRTAAILVRSGRKDEAKMLADELLQGLQSKELERSLSRGLKGEIPS
jgi:hypothetical protein